jgi:NADPH-dependent 2,4-dienoyl-CoA reductase/sulfur reductase-like enzyme
MLYTPLLPEVAAGAIEPRHVVVPLRIMCPHADVVRGRAVALDESARTVAVESELGRFEVEYERLVVALGAIPRMLPIPGLAEHSLAFNDVSDAVQLRNHVLRKLDHADADPGNAERHLTFVFVGAGYAGVEALAELTELVHDALRHYPRLRDVPQRWVLVDAGPKILAEVPGGLGDYAAEHSGGAASTFACRRRSSPSKRMPSRSPTARASTRTRSCGPPASSRIPCSHSSGSRSTSADASSSTRPCASRGGRTRRPASTHSGRRAGSRRR